MNKDLVLEINNLCIEYPGEATKIKNVSIRLNKGRVLGLAGESGSGKSTVGKAALGLLSGKVSHLSGSMKLCGREIIGLSQKQHQEINGKDIGYIMQNPMKAFNPCLKIKSHFTETICAHLPCSKRDALHIGYENLSLVGLGDTERIMGSYPFQLSGGMLQRVMIALTICLNPVLIIADEPTTALDTGSRNTVLKLLSHVMKRVRPAMLLISHDIEVIAKIADDTAIMQHGQIVEYGATKQILVNPAHEYTRDLMEAVRFSWENVPC